MPTELTEFSDDYPQHTNYFDLKIHSQEPNLRTKVNKDKDQSMSI